MTGDWRGSFWGTSRGQSLSVLWMHFTQHWYQACASFSFAFCSLLYLWGIKRAHILKISHLNHTPKLHNMLEDPVCFIATIENLVKV